MTNEPQLKAGPGRTGAGGDGGGDDVGDDLGAVRAYYDSTWFDYRALWLDPTNRAIHFGYWGAGARRHRDSLLDMNSLLADAAGVVAGDVVLDAGCGVGGSALWLAEERGARVIGITPVPGQVERARRYAAERGARGVEFRVGDFRATDLDDASVDVVWAQESVVHTPDKERFAAEARRVLRPGGRLVMAEYLRNRRALLPRDEAVIGSWCDGWAMADLATDAEMTAALERGGLSEVRVDDITPGVRRSLRRLHRITIGLWPIAAGLHALRLRSDAAHGNVVGARAQWIALERGLWHYGLVTARRP